MAPEIERRLAAILSADVVGYSRLMAHDEAATIRTLSDYREQVSARVRQHRGRVVDTPGDNILAEFPSALDAVRCAVEIQAVLRALNSSLSAERRMDFRIGVHMGDVATESGRIYGDGVNIAARLEGLAEAGGICISATVHEQVRNKLEAGFIDLGDQSVKNIPEQVRVYRVQPQAPGETPDSRATTKASGGRGMRRALIAAAAVLGLVVLGLWASWPRPLGLLVDLAGVSAPPVEPELPDNASIAVLPFTNMSGDPEQEYFSDGLTEDLTTELARMPHLFVIARNTAFQYKGQRVDVEQVGRELGVAYVLEGSVRRAGDQVRVTAQLIDAKSGGHVWSDRYDRQLDQVFTIQSEIAAEILSAVGVEISQAEYQRTARKPIQDFTTMDAVWRGLSHLNRQTHADNMKARELFERAIELDPRNGWPYAFLANTYLTEFSSGRSSDPALLDRAEELARKSIGVDATLPAGHIALAGVLFFRGETELAIGEAERAVDLAPNDAGAHAMLGLAQARSGRFVEASRSIKHALRLNPRPTGVLLTITAFVNRGAGRRDLTIQTLEKLRSESPDEVTVRVWLAIEYERDGRHEQAQRAAREALAIRPDLSVEEAMQILAPGRENFAPAEYARLPDYLRTAGFR